MMDWLIALPIWLQLAAVLGVLVPLAGAGAWVLLWLIDAATDRRGKRD